MADICGYCAGTGHHAVWDKEGNEEDVLCLADGTSEHLVKGIREYLEIFISCSSCDNYEKSCIACDVEVGVVMNLVWHLERKGVGYEFYD